MIDNFAFEMLFQVKPLTGKMIPTKGLIIYTLGY